MRVSSNDVRAWEQYRSLRAQDPDAAERGRLLAAHAIATDPEARKRVEDMVGVEAAAKLYPEAYQKTNRLFSGVVNLLDRVREAIPW